MIKGFGDSETGDKVILVGLSHDDLDQLRARKTFSIDLEHMGMPGRKIMLIAGETDLSIATQLSGLITKETRIMGMEGKT